MNDYKIMTIVFYVFVPLFVVVLLTTLYMLFYLSPVALIGERDCLQRGFPKATVTFIGEVYCVGYDGAIYPKIEKR